jgi:hypothetical protein
VLPIGGSLEIELVAPPLDRRGDAQPVPMDHQQERLVADARLALFTKCKEYKLSAFRRTSWRARKGRGLRLAGHSHRSIGASGKMSRAPAVRRSPLRLVQQKYTSSKMICAKEGILRTQPAAR